MGERRIRIRGGVSYLGLLSLWMSASIAIKRSLGFLHQCPYCTTRGSVYYRQRWKTLRDTPRALPQWGACESLDDVMKRGDVDPEVVFGGVGGTSMMMLIVALFFLFLCFYMYRYRIDCMCVAFMMMKIPSNDAQYCSFSLLPVLIAEGTVDRGAIAGIREHR